MSEATPTLDMATIEDLRALESRGTPGLVARLVRKFLDSSEGLMGELRDAAGTDPAAIAHVAHKLRSSSWQLGAVKLAGVAKELEELGRAGSCDGAPQLVERLSFEFETAAKALSALARHTRP